MEDSTNKKTDYKKSYKPFKDQLDGESEEELVDDGSEEYEKRLKEDLTCSICLDLMYLPVTNECGHTFCKHCL